MPPEKVSLRFGSRLTSCAWAGSIRYARSTSPRLSMARRVVASGTLLKTSRLTLGIFRQ